MSLQKKRIRAAFRTQTLQRDQHRCVKCGMSEQEAGHLDVHHITNRNEMPNGGYVPENGISLCPTCHHHAEQWHRSEHTTWHPGFHPDDLYQNIRSTHQRARHASQQLQ